MKEEHTEEYARKIKKEKKQLQAALQVSIFAKLLYSLFVLTFYVLARQNMV